MTWTLLLRRRRTDAAGNSGPQYRGIFPELL